ncbi:MAG: adenylate/guanylate cyclase domain-containing protein [Alphaproteobacteria bacterium]|nr:adenylate/guanylate cyclase domain-containing protein [Alphaproteobacteria bacterium]
MARQLPIILVAAATIVLAVGLRFLDPLPVTQLRLTVFDMFQRLQPREYAPAPVRVIDIDDESLSRLGQWPWPRTQIATIVERLSDLGAAAIAFAIVFAEPDRTTPNRVMKIWPRTAALTRLARDLAKLPDHDTILARVLSAPSSAPVVLGFSPTRREGTGAPPIKFGFSFIGADPTPLLGRYDSAIGNLPLLELSARGLGSLTIRLDRDGTARRMALVTRIGDTIYPSLGLEALRVAQGASTLIVRTSGGGEASGGAFVTGLKAGHIAVPTDSQGEIWLHYTEKTPERTVPAWKLFEDDISKLSQKISGQVVLVGVSASGLENSRATPLNPIETAATIHAQAIEQMLLGRFLVRAEWANGLEILTLPVLCGLLTWLIVSSRKLFLGASVGGLTVGIVWAGSWLAFDQAGLLFDPLYPTLSMVLVYLLASSFQYFIGERERRRVRTAFSRYLAPSIVERLAEHPEDLKLGGENRELTVMFCDIRGFTAIAEGMLAEELTQLVNRFLTPMSQEILEAKGTIDKYMGDSIMAFWNAPIQEPEHGILACRAALAMSRRLTELRPSWRTEAEDEGRKSHDIHIGIGLNSGPCCVGNFGSDQRFDYSALGDAVNVASRLEQQTRIYGVEIIVGEDTHRLTKKLAYLELDRVRVRGRSAAMTIFGLVGDENQASESGFQELRKRHDEALAAYREQEWETAEALFEDCRNRWNGALDDLYATYIVRLAVLRGDPPGPNWDGVFRQEPQ